MLQVDDALVDALHARDFEIAMESNGTLPAHRGIDWICISPKAGSEVVQRSGHELKLVWPQPGSDEIGRASCRKECVSTCRPRWSPYHYKNNTTKCYNPIQ